MKNKTSKLVVPDHDVYQYYEQLKEKVASGAIPSHRSIDPVVALTHDYLGRDRSNISPLTPQTDVPTGWRRRCTAKLYDKNFLDNYCVVLTSSSLFAGRKVDG
ncbi:hypothetical protein KCP78_19285 [Salmonella enterica subsp. enterica]|nr:hypothetical protein KCP78_19285 [Salmonella enterica subsp. enterica]